MRTAIWAVMALALFGHQSAAAATSDQVARGKNLSFQLCASCHQIDPAQKRPLRVYSAKTHSDVAALTFKEIAQRNGRDPHFLEQTLDEPHYPMLRRSLSNADKQDIIAYIKSLGS